jgi:hypothetical protein
MARVGVFMVKTSTLGNLEFASMIDGPVLGPFVRRSDALQAEADWLNSHRLAATATT